MRTPLIAPQPPRLSQHAHELALIEASGVYSNYGPVNSALENEFIESIFGSGSCVTVCNATIGLMLAIREVIGEDRPERCRYALMPSFTFAATAQAAIWCGLTPLLCDIDPNTWLPDEAHEQRLLQEYEGEIAVVVPYATFGNNLDLARYQKIYEQFGVPTVVDAAASLGSLDTSGRAFGADFPWPVVFSMHATKSFSVGEGGLIYCGDRTRIERLRAMGSFGFSQDRSAGSIGLNSKLSEVTALTALLQLRDYDASLESRERSARQYEEELGASFQLQTQVGLRQVRSFQSVLLPPELVPERGYLVEQLRSFGVGAGTYFSPHLAEQPYFAKNARFEFLPHTAEVASRILSLPLTSAMRPEQVSHVVTTLQRTTRQLQRRSSSSFQVPSSAPGERTRAA